MRQRRQKKTPQQNKTTPRSQHNSPEAQLTFLEHLYELRARLFWIVLSLVITSAIGFQYKDILVSVIMAPLHGQKLVYLTPGGGFSFIFTICLYFGALLTIPVIVYHVYRFLQPVLGATSRRLVVSILLISSLLAVAGASFGYFVAVPAAIQFLMTFAGDSVTPNLTAESYLGFIVAYMLGLAALFQLPLLLYMFDHVRPFPPGTLWSSQRFVIVGAVIAGAIITPTPDVINQMIIAGPIILIYQLGAAAVFLRHRFGKRSRAVREATTSSQPLVSSVQTHVPGIMPIPPDTATLSTTAIPQQPIQKVQPDKKVAPAVMKPVRSTSPAQAVHSDGARRRSLDGFTRRPTGVPARATPTEPTRRPMRSVDGLSVV